MQPIDPNILEALRKRVRQLPSSDRGDICAYWLDVHRLPPVFVADFLGVTAIAIRGAPVPRACETSVRIGARPVQRRCGLRA